MAEKSPLSELNKKDKVSGKVMKTTLAGAVVDIGRDKPAVIPISQLRKEPVRRVDEVLHTGDEVSAWVRRVNKDTDLVELSLIEPLALEWRELKKGMSLNGKVTRLESFGAFVDLGAERPGMVHVSEMSHDYVRRPEDVISVGDEVEVQVLEVNRRKKQIKLSMKALQPQAQEIVEEMKDNTPPPTSMEIALRKAMGEDPEEAQEQRQSRGKKKNRGEDMEDILARTLENRVKSK